MRILNSNLDANGTTNVDRSNLDIVLSNKRDVAFIWRDGQNNLGGSGVVERHETSKLADKHRENLHEINLVPGDQVLLKEAPAFMKIDVEGLEFLVLAGLKEKISTFRPKIFIEKNYDQFDPWVQANGYHVAWTDNHYAKVTNYLLLPE